MNDASTEKDLVSFPAYLLAQLRLLPKLPAIMRNVKHVQNVDKENRESWGSMLEENALKYPHNLAVKSDRKSVV